MTTKTKIDFESKTPLVHHVCKTFSRRFDAINKNNGYTYEDLFQIGCMGLLKAIEGFDESLGYEFSTYAYSKIKGEINVNLKRNTLLKSSRKDKEKLVTLHKMYGDSWMDIPVNILAESINVSKKKMLDLFNLYIGISSLNKLISESDSEELELIDVIADKHNIDSVVEENEFISSLLSQLNKKEQEIFKLYYLEGWSQKEIATKLGVSQPRVSFVIKNIKIKLHMLRTVAS